MPRPRRMATPASSNRAIMLVKTCPCGCDGLDRDCVVEPSDDEMPEWSECQQLALATHVKQGVVQQALNTGLIADMILAEAGERRDLMDKDLRELKKLAEEQNYTVVEEGSSLKWTSPEGGCISTPNRAVGRGLQNIKSQLRRLGLEIPRTGKATTSVDAAIDIEIALEHRNEKPVIPQEISQAYAALATLTEFVAGHQHDDESTWATLCEGLEVQVTDAKADAKAANDLLDEIRTALTTAAPWEALPRIANLLGITKESA